MDYIEDRYKRKEILHTIMMEIRVANPPPPDAPKEARGAGQWRGQSFPAPKHNGGPHVTEGRGAADGLTSYYAQGKAAPAGFQPHARRQQSLPSRRVGGEEKYRQANSAPSWKNRSQSQRAPPLPKLNSLVAKSRGPGGETSHIPTTNFAGFSTKDQEASPTRSTRFASTWAQVRAENHIDMCAPSPDGGAPRRSRQEDNRSGERATTDSPAARPVHQGHRTPQQEVTKANGPRSRLDQFSHAPPAHDKGGNPKHGAPMRKDPGPYHHTAGTGVPARRESPKKKEKQTIRFKDLEDEEGEGGAHNDESPAEDAPAQRARSHKGRPQWNNRLYLSEPERPRTPAKSWRRYEAELTHVPTLTSSQQVYKAYTGLSKQQLRDRRVADDDDDDDGYDDGEEDWSERRPGTAGSRQQQEEDENDEASKQGPKEYVLTRNEAKMFLHLQNVYGSEAFRQQRKEWFFKKLTDVQLQELQHQAAEKRRKQQRKEESKRRQKQQLMHVRRKFRREQLHRFRTQYVTSRVLEYERDDRDLYGLPGDWDDGDDFNGVDDGDDDDDDVDLDSNANHRKVHGSLQSGGDPDKRKSPESVGKQGVKDSHAHFARSEDATQKPFAKNKAKSDVSESQSGDVPVPRGNETLNSDPSSNKKVNPAGSKTTDGKGSVQVSSTQNPKTANRGDPASESAITAGDDHRNKASNARTPSTGKPPVQASTLPQSSSQSATAAKSSKQNSSGRNSPSNRPAGSEKSASSNTSKTTKRNAKQGKTGQNTATTQDSNKDNTSSAVPNSGSKPSESIDRNSAQTTEATKGAGKKQADNASSRQKETSSAATSNGLKNKDASHPDASPSETTVSKTQGSKAERTEGKSERMRNGVQDGSGSPRQGKDNKNKNSGAKKEESGGSLRDTQTAHVNEETKRGPDRRKENSALRERKDTSMGDNKQPATSSHNKGTAIITSTTSGSRNPPSKATSNTASPGDHPQHRQAADTVRQPVSGGPTAVTTTASKDGHSKPAAAGHPQSRRVKRKPAQSLPRSEAEQKKQLERKYGKIFKVNTGPTWDPAAKPPKMEGIDTVIVKVTDEKGRTRLKKREVKDVVKEAKAQVAQHDKENHRQAAGSSKYMPVPAEAHTTARPASADTLDFDEDEDDDDEEDVFERVRRKYNLQIDSDDEYSTA